MFQLAFVVKSAYVIYNVNKLLSRIGINLKVFVILLLQFTEPENSFTDYTLLIVVLM